jgi:arylsulfatase A-like enzyme
MCLGSSKRTLKNEEITMSAKKKRGLYYLTPALLVVIGLIIYLVFHHMGKKEDQPNVLFITMDSLRHDHLGCCEYEPAHTPNIDALAGDGTVFRGAVAQGTYTSISVPTMITGKFPYFTGIRTFRAELDSHHTTLAEVLSANGYATFATNKVWSQSFFQGFEEYGNSDDPTPERTERAIQGLEKLADQKFFIWLYYWDPHAPYDPPEEFMRIYEPDYVRLPMSERLVGGAAGKEQLRDQSGHFNGSIATLMKLNQGTIRLTSLDRKHLLNLYDAEIAFVDAEIGKLVVKLKQMELYDKTLIVLSADHGEAFGEHKTYYHGMTTYDELARVPLIIKPPHTMEKNKVVPNQVRNIDIMPTILDYCDLQAPEECNGQSLRPLIETKASPNLPGIIEVQAGRQNHLVALRHQGHKLIYAFGENTVQLYDLETDPEERKNLLPEMATMEQSAQAVSDPAWQREQHLRRVLLDLLSIEELADLKLTAKDLKGLDEKTKRQLRALGYVY